MNPKKRWAPSCLLLFGLTAVLSCGGEEGTGGDVNDPFNTAGLTDSEAAAVADAITQSTESVTADAAAGGPKLSVRAITVPIDVPLNGEYGCAVGGHITWTGNVHGSASEDYWVVSGLVQYQISDPTNNLNDCEPVKGVILDGTLTLILAGSSTTGGIGASLSGYIGVNERGPTGGLVPRGECWVFLNIARGATKATGTICGHTVS